jgi:hypothetical protein
VALPLEKLGSTYPPRTALIDPDRARQYAAATNDHNPAYEAGKVAPPVFGVVPTWDCLGQAIELVPPEATAPVTPTAEGAAAYVFEASSQGAVVVKNGLAEVV